MLSIVLVLLASKIGGYLSRKLNQPSVLGEILAGILIGPAVLGLLTSSESLLTFANVGVILLMFLAGLETNLSDLNKVKKSAFAVAVGGVILPILLGTGATYYIFAMEGKEAIFIGLVLAATSVSISVQTLRELGWLQTKEGSTLLGAAVLDDIIVMVMVAVAMTLLVGADSNITLMLVKIIGFFVAYWLVSKYLAQRIISFFYNINMPESLVAGALIVCFGLSYLAEELGMAAIIGAFFAGLAIGKTDSRRDIERRVEPIAYSIFVPFFFVSIGIDVSFKGLGSHIGFILIILIIAIISKFVGCGLGAKFTGFSNRSSMGIGSGMISRGEVALILASTGLLNQLLSAEYYTSVVLVVILTTVVTPPLMAIFFKKR